MEITFWALGVVAAWLLLVLPLAIACGRAFAAGSAPAELRVREIVR